MVRAVEPLDARAGPAPGALLVAIGARSMDASPRLGLALRLTELAAAVAAVVLSLVLTGPTSVVGLVGVSISSLAWVGWIAAGRRTRLVAASLLVMAMAGGVAAADRLPGVVFVGVAATGAASTFDLLVAVLVAAPGLVTFLIVSATHASLPSRPWMVGAVGLVGIVSGGGRRQLFQQGRQAILVTTAEQREAVARREAELTAERNRLGRELHDVLAHTLGAVSIQLTALDARVAAGDGPGDVRRRIEGIHGLVGEGLDEARDAVRALREDGPPVGTLLARLSSLHGATFAVDGPTRALGADATLTLYRVAQEALTNVDKHAPHTPAAVRLTFGPERVAVSVANGAPTGATPSPLAASGGGHGLIGLGERVQLAGGAFEAGSTGEGWQVTATLPAR